MNPSERGVSNPAVWILIPVHNRRETTRACLSNLRHLDLLGRYTVCVIDDGCSDGTGEMLSRDYPEVHILRGNGHLYWGGGISMGMATAQAEGAEIHVWLNDDCLPDRGSVETVVERVRITKGICGAVCRDPHDSSKITYSGTQKGLRGLVCPEPGSFELIDGMNGNLVAVHASVLETIGTLDAKRFPHYGGDDAYCIRARNSGVRVEIAGSATAVNARGTPIEAFGRHKPPSAILKEPFRTASSLYWPTYWHILRLAYGWKAFFRWPAYFVRLFSLWRAACRRANDRSSPV